MKLLALKLCLLPLLLAACGETQSKGNRDVRETTPDPLSIAAPYQAVVAADGSGDYVSVQTAIDAVPAGRTEPWRIFIKNGEYDEWVRIPEEKRFVHLIGEDRDRTVISYAVHCGGKGDGPWELSTHNDEMNNGNKYGSVFIVEAADFYAENLSIVNRFGVDNQSGPQALALRTDNDRAALYNCSLRSFQDTWRTSTTRMEDRHYALECRIEGAVDYIYGAGEVLFEKCTLYNVRSASVIVAPSHRPGTRWGYVFLNCSVDGNEQASDGGQLLGRPWHNFPIALYLNTTMKIPVSPEGWTNMGVLPKIFAEYNSVDGQGNPVDLSRRKTEYRASAHEGGHTGISRTTLSAEEASDYTYDDIIAGDDGWDPRRYMQR